MMKKFLSGVLVTALVLGSVAVASPKEAEAVSVPKAKYTFNMNSKNSKVVAVGRKGDTSSLSIPDTTKPNLPTEAQAKSIGASLKYEKGKHGKALYLDRTKSYGAQLKGVNVGSGPMTIAFWIKVPNGMGNFTSALFIANDVTDAKAKWISITRRADIADIGGSPTIWSRNVDRTGSKYGNTEGEWPWYNENGANDAGEAVWTNGDKLANAKSWTHITLVINTKKKGEYGAKGDANYTKGPMAITYVNGVAYGNGAVANGVLSSKCKWFLGINAWDTPMKAYYDDVTIWDKALTAKQVKAFYKSQK